MSSWLTTLPRLRPAVIDTPRPLLPELFPDRQDATAGGSSARSRFLTNDVTGPSTGAAPAVRSFPRALEYPQPYSSVIRCLAGICSRSGDPDISDG